DNSAPAKASTASSTDAFTSSTQSPEANATAQAAGLFSVNTLSLFTAAANFLLDNGSNAGGNSSAPTAATTPAPATTVAATSAPGGANTNVIVGESVPLAALLQNGNATVQTAATAPATANRVATAEASPAAASAATSPNTAAVPAAATTAATPQAAPSSASTSANTASDNVPATVPPPLPSVAQAANTSSELQSLNDLLAAEGLSASQIAQVDNVAQALNDYNPTAYSSLVNQLEFAAQTRISVIATGQSATVPTNLSTAVGTSEAPAPVALPKVSGVAAGVSKA
ncbi:MAG: hypothetical protein ABSG69_17140, partial [Candidatus Acidiferrum sp.]